MNGETPTQTPPPAEVSQPADAPVDSGGQVQSTEIVGDGGGSEGTEAPQSQEQQQEVKQQQMGAIWDKLSPVDGAEAPRAQEMADRLAKKSPEQVDKILNKLNAIHTQKAQRVMDQLSPKNITEFDFAAHAQAQKEDPEAQLNTDDFKIDRESPKAQDAQLLTETFKIADLQQLNQALAEVPADADPQQRTELIKNKSLDVAIRTLSEQLPDLPGQAGVKFTAEEQVHVQEWIQTKMPENASSMNDYLKPIQHVKDAITAFDKAAEILGDSLPMSRDELLKSGILMMVLEGKINQQSEAPDTDQAQTTDETPENQGDNQTNQKIEELKEKQSKMKLVLSTLAATAGQQLTVGMYTSDMETFLELWFGGSTKGREGTSGIGGGSESFANLEGMGYSTKNWEEDVKGKITGNGGKELAKAIKASLSDTKGLITEGHLAWNENGDQKELADLLDKASRGENVTTAIAEVMDYLVDQMFKVGNTNAEALILAFRTNVAANLYPNEDKPAFGADVMEYFQQQSNIHPSQKQDRWGALDWDRSSQTSGDQQQAA